MRAKRVWNAMTYFLWLMMLLVAAEPVVSVAQGAASVRPLPAPVAQLKGRDFTLDTDIGLYLRILPNDGSKAAVGTENGVYGAISCFSVDGKNCSVPAYPFTVAKPLYCGAEHKAIYGSTGYDTRKHWCSRAYAKYLARWTYHGATDRAISVNPDGDVQCYARMGDDVCTGGKLAKSLDPKETTDLPAVLKKVWATNPSPFICTGYGRSSVCGKAYGAIGNFVAVLNDTQFRWTHCLDDANSDRCRQEKATYRGDEKAASRDYNIAMRDAIARLSASLGPEMLSSESSIKTYGNHRRKIVATIINGDLTAFGSQHDYLDFFKSIWGASNIGVSHLYPGLGNHDYENNVNDCWRNQCAIYMLDYFYKRIKSDPFISFFDAQMGDNGTDFKWWSGSLAYSWNIGKFHFVQLNNYPSYTREWYNDNITKFAHTKISAGTGIMDKDLADSDTNKEPVILNFHRTEDFVFSDQALIQKLDKHKVAAIFNGHVHNASGQYRTVTTKLGSVPAFIAGTPMEGQFMLVQLRDKRLCIWKMLVDIYQKDALDNPMLYVVDKYGAKFPVDTRSSRSLMQLFESDDNNPVGGQYVSYVVPL